MECHAPQPGLQNRPKTKRKGVSRTSLLIVQQRWVVSELITLAPKTLIGLKLCQSRQHAWGPCRQQNGWCYTGPEKERKALISTVVVVPGMPGQRKNTDFGGGGAAFEGPRQRTKTRLSKMRDAVELWGT